MRDMKQVVLNEKPKNPDAAWMWLVLLIGSGLGIILFQGITW